MNKCLSILGFLLVFLSGCVAQNVQADPLRTNIETTIQYQTVLGKSFNDRGVVNFFVDNNCSTVAQFEICKEKGMSFWIDSNQKVGYAYLYSGNTDGFQRYRGKLPYGLSFNEPMWFINAELKKIDTDKLSPMAGLPDQADTSDHIHYWAIYKRLGLAVVYDSGIADPDAYIYAVLMVNRCSSWC